jgi:hypothetical protein
MKCTSSDAPEAVEPSGVPPADSKADSGATRRGFLGDIGKKTAYITPVVLTLTAQRALALGSHPSANPSAECLDTGELCEDDPDCCSGQCTGGVCE